MPGLLFIYGTLHPDRAPAEIADAARGLRPVGPGTIRGKLYDLGEYPGVMLDPSTSETIHGEVFAVPDAETLARLDRYEDYRPEDASNSLFLRVQTTVTLDAGSTEVCWVYVYNRELPLQSV
jgi:gamma-glutamylcyclotransferase (GGCT)/AIG2-like uncharacterized protein YtfP